MRLRTLSVSELNKYIKRMITSDPILGNIHLKGEISNFKIHTSGHAYFSMKDDKSKVNCVMFREDLLRVKFTPTEGLNVIVRGYVSTYERDGQYQVYIQEIEPDGIGSLYLALHQLKQKLQEEGLFDPSFKKALPPFPKKIAVITSATGAAIRDVLSVLQRRNSSVDIVIFPVTVQGETAPMEIAQAINEVNKLPNIDIIILTRGGGSIEELWSFNEEIVARSIFSSQIPVISAVGHETDYTISDYVSDMRAPTPSAAAEIAVFRQKDLQNQLDNFMHYLDNKVLSRIKEKKKDLANFHQDRLNNLLKGKLRAEQQRIDTTFNDLQIQSKNMIEKYKNDLFAKSYKLDTLNPFSTLRRGYAIVLDNEHRKTIKSIEQINRGDNINIMLTDGAALCKVSEISKEDKKFELPKSE